MASLQMQQSVHYIVNQALGLLSLDAVSGVYDQAEDETARLMGIVTNVAGIFVNDASDWQSQRADLVLDGDGARTAFDLPADLSRIVRDTGWSEMNQCPVTPLDAQQSARLRAQVVQEGTALVCRIVRNQLVFAVAPIDGERISFEYIRLTWVHDAEDNTVMKAVATKNGDLPAFDWLLMAIAVKLKWLEAKRMDTSAATTEFNDRLRQLQNNDVIGETLSLSGQGGGMRYLSLDNVPAIGIGGP